MKSKTSQGTSRTAVPREVPIPGPRSIAVGDPTRAQARAIGILFLAAMFTYGPGSALVASVLGAPDRLTALVANPSPFTWGAVLMLGNSAVVVTIGVLLFPIIRQHSDRVALGYYACRLVEGALLAVGVVALLSLLTIADLAANSGDVASFDALGAVAIRVNEVSYQVAMTALGLGSLFFCAVLHRTGLVPRPIAAWGVVGYGIFLAGAVLEIVGIGAGLLLSIPGGLFEVFLGIWLLVKGFAPPRSTVSARTG